MHRAPGTRCGDHDGAPEGDVDQECAGEGGGAALTGMGPFGVGVATYVDWPEAAMVARSFRARHIRRCETGRQHGAHLSTAASIKTAGEAPASSHFWVASVGWTPSASPSKVAASAARHAFQSITSNCFSI